MHIIVCIKSVPETTEVRFHPETNTLMREGAGAQINPFDLYAIEEAVRVKEAHGGLVTVLTMGPPRAEEQLREALAVGCDETVLLSSAAFAGSDTWVTAYTLAQAIRRLGAFDLILCGKQAIDGDTGQVGPGIAAQLGLPQLTYVSRLREVDPAAGILRAERLLEEGCEVAETRLPALLTVLKDINKPRDPSPRLLRRARRAEIPVWTEADLPEVQARFLGLEGSPTKVVQVFSPPKREGGVRWIVGESPQAQAAALVAQLIADGVVN